MKALILQHDHISPPGVVRRRLEDHGFNVEELGVVPEKRYRTPDVQFAFPAVDDYDLVVLMGAPWGAWDDSTIGPWLSAELEWIRALHAADVPVLGICFGGQAIARALGGSVAPGPTPELGFSMIHSDEPGLVSDGPWFQFHYDRWQVPPGAREIARNPIASQAFVIGRTLALQFHPEVDSEVLDVWALDEDLTTNIAASGQDFEVMRRQVAACNAGSWERGARLIDAFLEQCDCLVPSKGT